MQRIFGPKHQMSWLFLGENSCFKCTDAYYTDDIFALQPLREQPLWRDLAHGCRAQYRAAFFCCYFQLVMWRRAIGLLCGGAYSLSAPSNAEVRRAIEKFQLGDRWERERQVHTLRRECGQTPVCLAEYCSLRRVGLSPDRAHRRALMDGTGPCQHGDKKAGSAEEFRGSMAGASIRACYALDWLQLVFVSDAQYFVTFDSLGRAWPSTTRPPATWTRSDAIFSCRNVPVPEKNDLGALHLRRLGAKPAEAPR